jgi:hypothetical protein
MTPQDILDAARADGVVMAVTAAGNIQLVGARAAVDRWRSHVRYHKVALVALLADAGAVPTATSSGAAPAPNLLPAIPPSPFFPIDDTFFNDDAEPEINEDVQDEVRRLVDKVSHQTSPGDERRCCSACRNLSLSGQCLAAARGELNAVVSFEPIVDMPQRCAGYLPGPDDPDQRTGRERHWPA